MQSGGRAAGAKERMGSLWAGLLQSTALEITIRHTDNLALQRPAKMDPNSRAWWTLQRLGFSELISLGELIG